MIIRRLPSSWHRGELGSGAFGFFTTLSRLILKLCKFEMVGKTAEEAVVLAVIAGLYGLLSWKSSLAHSS